jgi:hypothetical protein
MENLVELDGGEDFAAEDVIDSFADGLAPE